MTALEGLFRKLGAATGRDRDSILRRMVALRVPRGVEDDPAIGVRARPCVRHRHGTTTHGVGLTTGQPMGAFITVGPGGVGQSLNSKLKTKNYFSGPTTPTTPRRSVGGCGVSWARDEGGPPRRRPRGCRPRHRTRGIRALVGGRFPWSQGCGVGLRAPILVSFTTGSSRGQEALARGFHLRLLVADQ